MIYPKRRRRRPLSLTTTVSGVRDAARRWLTRVALCSAAAGA